MIPMTTSTPITNFHNFDSGFASTHFSLSFMQYFFSWDKVACRLAMVSRIHLPANFRDRRHLPMASRTVPWEIAIVVTQIGVKYLALFEATRYFNLASVLESSIFDKIFRFFSVVQHFVRKDAGAKSRPCVVNHLHSTTYTKDKETANASLPTGRPRPAKS
jgi:hypothetical protein